MRRGELWLAEVGGRPPPVLVVTRDEVIDVRADVTVAEVTTRERGLGVELPVDTDVGLDASPVIDCDGPHTIGRRRLTTRLGSVDDDVLGDVCRAVATALGCGPA